MLAPDAHSQSSPRVKLFGPLQDSGNWTLARADCAIQLSIMKLYQFCTVVAVVTANRLVPVFTVAVDPNARPDEATYSRSTTC